MPSFDQRLFYLTKKYLTHDVEILSLPKTMQIRCQNICISLIPLMGSYENRYFIKSRVFGLEDVPPAFNRH